MMAPPSMDGGYASMVYGQQQQHAAAAAAAQQHQQQQGEAGEAHQQQQAVAGMAAVKQESPSVAPGFPASSTANASALTADSGLMSNGHHHAPGSDDSHAAAAVRGCPCAWLLRLPGCPKIPFAVTMHDACRTVALHPSQCST
jgi:hypothetical protein